MPDVTTTATDRRIEYMPLDDIPRAAKNPKEHDLATIRQSIEDFGATVAGILDERTGRLVAGHGRLAVLEQMRDAGEDPPAGVQVNNGTWLAPIVRGWASASDTAASAYLVADNRIPERGGWNKNALAEILDEIMDTDVDLLPATGWTADDLDDMLAEIGTTDVMPPSETGARYAETDEEFADRTERIANYKDRREGGTVSELILVMSVAEREEFADLLRRIRERDGDMPAGQIALVAMRAYAPPPTPEEET